MKNSTRIGVSQREQSLTIEIHPIQDKTKSNLLLAWLLVWTLCGVLVFSQFFSNMSKEEKLLMAVWMAFWAYFEYKIGNAYLWRKSGKELISIDQENLIYKQQVGQKVNSKSFLLDNISELSVYEFGKNNFSDSVQNSYWVKGNETVFFMHFGSKIGIGLQLNKEEANQLFHLLKKQLKKK